MVVRQAGRPDALGRGQTLEIAGPLVRQHMGIELPMLHILRVINGNPGKPLKAGNRDIIVVFPAADAGVRMKAGKNRILEFHQNAASLFFVDLNLPNCSFLLYHISDPFVTILCFFCQYISIRFRSEKDK